MQKKKMKSHHMDFIAGALSTFRIPLLAGFWSKDEILGFAWDNGKIHYLCHPVLLNGFF